MHSLYFYTDTVPYKLYKTAAYKYDGANYTDELDGVIFTLKENGTDFPVTKHTDGYYYPDTTGSASVTTDSNGLIMIRGLDNDKAVRVTFSEITKNGIETGMAHPRKLDMDLINAQQARRVLDRIVGYKLSPFLWKKVRRGLSAGRVQSAVVRLIVDREKEINAFQSQEYATLHSRGGFFSASYSKA